MILYIEMASINIPPPHLPGIPGPSTHWAPSNQKLKIGPLELSCVPAPFSAPALFRLPGVHVSLIYRTFLKY